MKRYLCVSVLFCFFTWLQAYIPFNPLFDKTTGLPFEFDSSNKKSTDNPVKDFVNDIQIGSLDVLDQTSFKRKFAGNATRKGVSGSVQTYNQNWQPAKQNIEPWLSWYKEDRKAGRLFRPFVFYDVMGMREYNFQDALKKGISFPIIDFIKQNKKNPKKMDVKKVLEAFPGREKLLGARFGFVDIKTLRKEYNKAKTQGNIKKAKEPGAFKILDGWKIWAGDKQHLKLWGIQEGGLLNAIKYTDIRYLQEANPGAVFQLASTFAALEGGMGKADTMLESMQHAPVQGENASLGTMGGTIVRKYAFHSKENINLLKSLKDKLMVNDIGLITSIKKQLTEDDVDKVRLGLHWNVMVTSGYYPPYIRLDDNLKKNISVSLSDAEKIKVKNSNKSLGADIDNRIKYLFNNKLVRKDRNPIFVYNSVLKKEIRVDQVLTAALNLNSKTYPTTEFDKQTAKILLKAAYLGTVLAAAARGTKKLFLTLVGAGAFKNDLNWIVEALEQKEIQEIIAYTGMEVVLVNYVDIRGKTAPKIAQEWKPFEQKAMEWNKKIEALHSPGLLELEKLSQALSLMSA